MTIIISNKATARECSRENNIVLCLPNNSVYCLGIVLLDLWNRTIILYNDAKRWAIGLVGALGNGTLMLRLITFGGFLFRKGRSGFCGVLFLGSCN